MMNARDRITRAQRDNISQQHASLLMAGAVHTAALDVWFDLATRVNMLPEKVKNSFLVEIVDEPTDLPAVKGILEDEISDRVRAESSERDSDPREVSLDEVVKRVNAYLRPHNEFIVIDEGFSGFVWRTDDGDLNSHAIDGDTIIDWQVGFDQLERFARKLGVLADDERIAT